MAGEFSNHWLLMNAIKPVADQKATAANGGNRQNTVVAGTDYSQASLPIHFKRWLLRFKVYGEESDNATCGYDAVEGGLKTDFANCDHKASDSKQFTRDDAGVKQLQEWVTGAFRQVRRAQGHDGWEQF